MSNQPTNPNKWQDAANKVANAVNAVTGIITFIKMILPMLKTLYAKLKELGGFLGKWNELTLAIVALAMWPVFITVLRILDPTAAPLDAGVLHIMYLALMWFSIVHGFVWVGLKLNMLVVYDYFENTFATDLKGLTPWQRLIASLFILSVYLFGALLSLIAVAMIAG